MAPRLFFRISFANATLLSVAYLSLGAAIELVRRIFNPRWAESLSLTMESFPARLMELMGLLEPLRAAYGRDELSAFGVRLIYGGVTVTVVYATGLLVGGLMWLLATATKRPKSGGQVPPEL